MGLGIGFGMNCFEKYDGDNYGDIACAKWYFWNVPKGTCGVQIV
jgi:hypothetical protein